MSKHPQKAAAFLQDQARAKWHDQSIWTLRDKRDRSVKQLEDWEALREQASQIKDHTLSQLDSYLLQFEAQAQKNGVIVHWAKDGLAHNQIVHEILSRHQVKHLVKSKSMLTEECHLNEYLIERGIEVIDTDLGERIIQLRNEAPSHIVAPAIHLKREEIGELFHEKLGTDAGASDPQYLTEAARQHLRGNFLKSSAALTGVNFAVAETGGIVVCTNEGNADMGVHLAPLQIHSMGIEKIIPKAEHLGVFTRLLARSATGQDITIYTAHHHRPKAGGEMHVVIVDNGRSEQLGREDFRASLKCIRCGACMNTCPIYRRSGGHSYDYIVPGPIGSILTPGKDLKKYSDLPFASSLCGSCSDVCPVKIDIHQQLYKWRQVIVEAGEADLSKKVSIQQGSRIMANPSAFLRWGTWLRRALRFLPRFMIYHSLNPWGKQRELPPAPKQSFHDWYQQNRSHEQ